PLLQSCLERNPKRRLRDIGDAWRLLESAPPSTRLLKSSWLAWGAAASFAIVAGVAFWSPWRVMPPMPQSMRFQVPLPDKTNVGLFAVSPDGRWFAFIGRGSDGVRRVWLRPFDSLGAQPLRGTESTRTPPFWSADRRFIAFDAGGKLKKIDITGGPPETICDLSTNVIGGAWSPDGVIIFGSLGPVMRVPAAGGVPSPVTSLDNSRSENRHILPVF